MSAAQPVPLSPPLVGYVDQLIRREGLGRSRLYAFWTVVQCGSFAAAAGALGMHDGTQVRKKVRTLEDELSAIEPEVVLVVTESNASRVTKLGLALHRHLCRTFGHDRQPR